jgi:site-specific DNA-methyltransferase (adenine-specific)
MALIKNFSNGTLYLGNAMELIKEVESNSIDLILTDPPYGLNFDEFDDPNVFFNLEDELYRVAKSNSWLVFFYSVKELPNAFKLKKFSYVWQIIGYFPTTHSKSLLGDRSYLPIFVFKKGDPKVYFKRSDVLPCSELPIVCEKVGNPLFKPTVLISLLIQMFSKEGDMILDPFSGFGSIPIVCEIFNRRWIGFEIDGLKYRIAIDFIENRRVGRLPSDKN